MLKYSIILSWFPSALFSQRHYFRFTDSWSKLVIFFPFCPLDEIKLPSKYLALSLLVFKKYRLFCTTKMILRWLKGFDIPWCIWRFEYKIMAICLWRYMWYFWYVLMTSLRTLALLWSIFILLLYSQFRIWHFQGLRQAGLVLMRVVSFLDQTHCGMYGQYGILGSVYWHISYNNDYPWQESDCEIRWNLKWNYE